MKIISNTDINNLIIYSIKNLSIYKLVYKEQKKMYYLSIANIFISFLLLIIYIFLTFNYTNIFWERICSFSCLFSCIFSLWLLMRIEIKTKQKHLEIQNTRFKLLKKYYSDNKYTSKL